MYLDYPGVYKIENIANGSFYVGSTYSLAKRKSKHFRTLKKGDHYNIHLQRAFNKYGVHNFIFSAIIVCDKHNLSLYEQALIDGLHPNYNIRIDATSNIGVRKSDEEKIRIGKMFKGKKLSKDHIKNRDMSRMVRSMERNPMSNIQILPSGKFRAKVAQKHLGCFLTLEEAIQCRTDYINSLFGGG